MEFQHIPLPELRTVASEGLIHTGENNEGVSGPYYNSGLFQAMVQQGDMIAAFCGHNHTNTYIGTLDGVDLAALRRVPASTNMARRRSAACV
ncbi:MAG: hypothetical protein ACLTB5_11865 [Acutalibacteraceae bacterium]